jgi:hypothetical protein
MLPQRVRQRRIGTDLHISDVRQTCGNPDTHACQCANTPIEIQKPAVAGFLYFTSNNYN